MYFCTASVRFITSRPQLCSCNFKYQENTLGGYIVPYDSWLLSSEQSVCFNRFSFSIPAADLWLFLKGFESVDSAKNIVTSECHQKFSGNFYGQYHFKRYPNHILKTKETLVVVTEYLWRIHIVILLFGVLLKSMWRKNPNFYFGIFCVTFIVVVIVIFIFYVILKRNHRSHQSGVQATK